MNNKKVVAIVPALNEEANIERVLKVLTGSEELDEVILIDDGSTDNTAQIGENLGVRTIKLSKAGGSGKGNAILQGIKLTDADVVVFFDADLINLTKEHISSLIQSVLAGEAVMCVGIRGTPMNMPENFFKLDPLLAISGQRAVKRELFKNIPNEHLEGFAIETTLNHYCLENNLPVCYIILDNLDHITKEKKWGIWTGFGSRIKMIFEIIKMRVKIMFRKKWINLKK